MPSDFSAHLCGWMLVLMSGEHFALLFGRWGGNDVGNVRGHWKCMVSFRGDVAV